MSRKQKKIAYMTLFSEILHPGIIESINQARKHSDRLICGILTDEILEEQGVKPVIGLEDRKRIIESIRFVDQVMIQNTIGPNKNLEEIHKKNPGAQIILVHNSKANEVLGKNYLDTIGGRLLQVEDTSNFSMSSVFKNSKKTLIKKREILPEEKRFVQAWGGTTSIQSLECHTRRYVNFPKHFSNSIIEKIYCEVRKGHHTVYFNRRDINRWYEEGKKL